MKPILLGPQERIAADQFRAFYAGLLAVRDSIRVPMLVPAAADAAAAPPVGAASPPAPKIDAVRTDLARLITDFGYRPMRIDAPAEVDAGYVMAAVADEVILAQCPEWDEREAWADRPLEAVLYGSRLAGERIFTAADDLVAQRRADPRAATAILLALLTGFEGRFRGHEDRGRIVGLEAGLYALVCKRRYAPDDPVPYAGPDLAATTLAGESIRRLPALWPWLVAIVMIALAYLPVSHLLWWLHVSAIDDLATNILMANPDGTNGIAPP